MSSSSLLLFFFLLLPLITTTKSQSPPPPLRSLLINCGSTRTSSIDNQSWLSDTPFITFGTPKTLQSPNLLPILSTLRSFPLNTTATTNLKKFCYVVPVFRNGKYLVRTTYYYGGINGVGSNPPVFDQIVDGTVWSVVNTTDDHAKGLSSYYEGVFVARGKMMSVCVAPNTNTESDPFISALEFVLLGASLYNSTDFGKYGLSLVARNNFGYGGPIIKYPDDPFDRYWEPFGDNNTIIQSIRNVSVSGFWNLPPSKVFDTQLTTDQVKPMVLQWPSVSLPNSTYYISLYLADNRDFPSEKSRIFNVTVNGIEYYRNLNVPPTGVVVFATLWPLSGLTAITLTPAPESNIGPVINAGEVFEVLLLGGRTATRDVIALERMKNSLQNPPIDWSGDPCLPRQYSWTGVTCSEGSRIRVVSLNISSMGLSGSISDSIANMTALTDIWMANNNLSGSIPDLSSLRRLETLHLENNQLSGKLPPSLGTIDSLRELFVQNNNLTGEVPNRLRVKPGLNLMISPGNSFSFQPPSSTK